MAKLPAKQLFTTTVQVIRGIGYDRVESYAIARNLVEAEWAGKKSHGLVYLFIMKKFTAGTVPGREKMSQCKKGNAIFLDAQQRTGYLAMDQGCKSLIRLSKNKSAYSYHLLVRNSMPTVGCAGVYARRVAKRGLCYIGFHNSAGGLHASNLPKDVLGTNPYVFAFPSEFGAIVFDAACSNTSWSECYRRALLGQGELDWIAYNADGVSTQTAEEALDGSFDPEGGYKGLGLAFMLELFAGALTGSKIFQEKKAGWGSHVIIVDPDFGVVPEHPVSRVEPYLSLFQSASGPDGFRVPGLIEKPDEYLVEVDDALLTLLRKEFRPFSYI